jgi:hypothetical protein
MGNAPSVVFKTEVLAPVTGQPFLNHALITFRPSTSDFLTGFTTSSQLWMFKDQNSLLGLVAEVGPNNWQSRLLSLGATSTEPVWRALDSLFNQQSVADAQGNRTRIPLPDAIYLGRRTSAVISQAEIEFVDNVAGTTRVRINPAGFIFAGSTPAGSLADVSIVSDGALTPTQLAAALAAALNALPAFTGLFSATPALGVVTIASDVAGYPLIIDVSVTTPGPDVTNTRVTANVANAYRDDLIEMQTAFELGSHLNPPMRRAYWITDLQADDVVNAEGFKFAEDQADVGQFNPPRPYIFQAWSSTGSKAIYFDGDLIGNFDPTATASAAVLAKAANNSTGWTRGSVNDHDRYEFNVTGLLGRCIGFLPGQVSFTSKVLYGSTTNSRMTGRDYGDNESLSQDNYFNWYSAEGARGSQKWGYLSNGSFIDRIWLADYSTYLCTLRLREWMQLKDIVTYSDDDIEAGAGIVAAALTELPAINPSTITVTFLTRAQVSSNDIALRVYKFYAAFADTFGVINQIGTLAEPINVSLQDA